MCVTVTPPINNNSFNFTISYEQTTKKKQMDWCLPVVYMQSSKYSFNVYIVLALNQHTGFQMKQLCTCFTSLLGDQRKPCSPFYPLELYLNISTIPNIVHQMFKCPKLKDQSASYYEQCGQTLLFRWFYITDFYMCVLFWGSVSPGKWWCHSSGPKFRIQQYLNQNLILPGHEIPY